MRRPKQLKAGSRVAAVCLSHGIAGALPELYDWGRQQLAQHLGLELVPMTHTLRSFDELYQQPALRVADFYEAWERPDIDGVISVIGGDDSVRLLQQLDPQRVQKHCKVFVGCSDTTATHLFLQHCGLASFYGPAVLYGFADFGGLSPYTADSFRKACMSGEPIGEIKPFTGSSVNGLMSWANPEVQKLPPTRLNPPWRWVNGKGRGQGRLFGGCLEVIFPMLAGTFVWPRDPGFWDDKILFLEYSRELAQEEYTVWFLRSLAAQGVFARIQGLLLGRQHFLVEQEVAGKIQNAFLKVIVHEERLHNLPMIFDMDFGHVQPMLTLPYGALAEIDGTRETFSILEAATSG